MAAAFRWKSARRRVRAIVATVLALSLTASLALAGCSASEGSEGDASQPASSSASTVLDANGGTTASASEAGTTDGPAFETPASLALSPYHPESLQGSASAGVDASSAAQGYVCAVGTSESRLKFQVSNGASAYNYDLPSDGTPTAYPLNMGSGTYTFRIMQNTTEDRYVELFSTTAEVVLASEFEPFLRPSFFCSYNASSAVVAKAHELASGAANQGDVLRAVYGYIVQNVSYDSEKAARLADTSGYVPSPDSTLQEGKGICFDYASLAAAMLRSLGIPCKIVTGYVSPEDVYHAWNMVYLDGAWRSVELTVEANKWTRVDMTFAASGSSSSVGDGSQYTDRYVY